jgi:hypothetical protein
MFISLHKSRDFTKRQFKAARVTLRLPMVIEDLGDKLEFSDMTGAYLYELWKYHERIRTDLKSGLPEFRNSRLPEGVKALRCAFLTLIPPSLLRDGLIITSSPLRKLLISLISSNSKMRGHATSRRSRYSYSRTCPCVDISSQLRRDFWEALTAFVDGAIERVRRAGVTRLHFDN